MDLILLLWPACINVIMAWHRQLWGSELVLAVCYFLKISGFLLPIPPKHLEISTMVNSPWADWQALNWAAERNPGAALPSWAPPGILYSLMFHWSLSWLRSFLSLLGDLREPPHPALNTECLPPFCSPTGGWVLCLSTRTPLLDSAGTSSPLPRARRSFHCIFPVLTPFPWCYWWPLPDCQSVSGQQCSSSLVSFSKCVWKRLLAAEVWRAVTQRACRERVWCQDETHGSGCEAAAQRRVSAAH